MSFTALLGAAIHDGITLQKGKALLCEDDQIVGIKDSEGLPAICEIRHLDGGYLEHFHFMLMHSLHLRGSSSIGLG